jgi:hypothetical protein
MTQQQKRYSECIVMSHLFVKNNFSEMLISNNSEEQIMHWFAQAQQSF